jgi:hypothetical protein
LDVDGAVVCTGAGAAGTYAGAGATSTGGDGAGVASGSVVLVVEVEAAVRLAARAPMIPRKPPTESSAVATRAWAAACRRCEEGLLDITCPSVGAISQNWLRAG